MACDHERHRHSECVSLPESYTVEKVTAGDLQDGDTYRFYACDRPSRWITIRTIRPWGTRYRYMNATDMGYMTLRMDEQVDLIVEQVDG